MFVHIPNKVLMNHDLTCTAKLVYGLHKTVPSANPNQISKMMGQHSQHVYVEKRYLESKGLW